MTEIPRAAPPAPLSRPFDHPEGETEHGGLELDSLGMWVFLAGEVMFFGAVFTVYMALRYQYGEAFAAASQHLNVMLGGINTAILLTSSFAMALAVQAAQLGRRKTLVFFLLLTVALGAAFLGIKAVEYTQEFRENLFPGPGFAFDGGNILQARTFFSLYFVMTGLHALHMIIGMAALLALAFFAWRGKFAEGHYAPVEIIGLFWHFVDLVWIFLFPLLYLIHPH